MGNVCGGTKSLQDSPTHHRLGSVSEPPPAPRPQASVAAPAAVPKPPRAPATRPAQRAQPANSLEERERRAQAAEERAKASAARGTVASNPKRGQLAAKLNEPVSRTEDRDEPPLRWD